MEAYTLSLIVFALCRPEILGIFLLVLILHGEKERRVHLKTTTRAEERTNDSTLAAHLTRRACESRGWRWHSAPLTTPAACKSSARYSLHTYSSFYLDITKHDGSVIQQNLWCLWWAVLCVLLILGSLGRRCRTVRGITIGTLRSRKTNKLCYSAEAIESEQESATDNYMCCPTLLALRGAERIK